MYITFRSGSPCSPVLSPEFQRPRGKPLPADSSLAAAVLPGASMTEVLRSSVNESPTVKPSTERLEIR